MSRFARPIQSPIQRRSDRFAKTTSPAWLITLKIACNTSLFNAGYVATVVGFTPQYDELENLYEKYNKEGFEVLDFPCNQFGNQAPESDDEIHTFCQLNYKVKFDQFAKVEVNGENAIPLFKYLKEEKGFAGFDPKHKLTSILNEMLSKNDPDFAKKPDIKWNFTKFLVDKSGNIVARFEPTTSVEVIEQEIKKLLEK